MNDCKCDKCKSACSHKPGWLIPGEAEKIADYLGMPLKELFRSKLMVDFWTANSDVFVLSPAIVGEEAGEVFPYDPRGQCVFFTKKGLCSIHEVKPYECRMANHDTVRDTDGVLYHEKAKQAWEGQQAQIVELLGREPEVPEDDDSCSILSGLGFGW